MKCMEKSFERKIGACDFEATKVDGFIVQILKTGMKVTFKKYGDLRLNHIFSSSPESGRCVECIS